MRAAVLVYGLVILLSSATAGAAGDRSNPIDNVRQAVALKAGIVASGNDLHFRCGCACPVIAFDSTAEPTSPIPAPPSADPVGAVRALVGAFGRRSEPAYAGLMTDDFLFGSDDPAFQTSFPSGMSREAERAFATHLFEGGGKAPDGHALPIAARVDTSMGAITLIPLGADLAQARVVLHDLRVLVTFVDRTTLDLGGTQNVMDLVLTESGWRIRRWLELHATAAVADSLAQSLGQATPNRVPPRGPLRPGDAPDAALPTRLALAVRGDRTSDALVFAVELPKPGGALELFDLQGRRLMRRDLTALGAGRHTVALEGAQCPAGIYWARLRQAGESATAKAVWVR